MMKDFWTADIQDDAVHKIREHNFQQHELAMRNQNGCSSLGHKNLHLIQTQSWKNWCSSAHVKNQKIVPNVDIHLNYDKGQSSVNIVHVGENSKGSWQDLESYNQEKH